MILLQFLPPRIIERLETILEADGHVDYGDVATDFISDYMVLSEPHQVPVNCPRTLRFTVLVPGACKALSQTNEHRITLPGNRNLKHAAMLNHVGNDPKFRPVFASTLVPTYLLAFCHIKGVR